MLIGSCNSSSLLVTLSAFKRIINLIQIIVPILLMIGATIGIYQMVTNPERKNGLKSIINKVIAAAIVFFIPVFVNAVMGIVGDNNNFSSCWNAVDANSRGSAPSEYVDPYENDNNRSSVIPDSKDYEKGKKRVVSATTSSSSTSGHKPSGSVTPVNPSSSNANKVIFLGDSRTVQLYAYLTSKWGSANYSSGGVHVVGNDVFIAQGGQGLNWMKSTGIPEANRYFGPGSALVILMGVNDLGNIEKYISYLESNASKWAATGTKIYFVSVNPCDGSRNSLNNRISTFNTRLSNKLPNDVQWIDTSSYLISSGFTTTDGLHYNKDTSYKIYNYIKSKV